MEKEKFEKLYYSMPNKEVGLLLGVNENTIISYARKFNLKMKGKGYYYPNDKRRKTKVNFF